MRREVASISQFEIEATPEQNIELLDQGKRPFEMVKQQNSGQGLALPTEQSSSDSLIEVFPV